MATGQFSGFVSSGNSFFIDAPSWVIVCVNLVSSGNKDLIDVYYSRCLTAGWLWDNRWIVATGRFSGFFSTGNSFLSMAHVGLLPELILFPVETTFLSKPKVVFACVDLFSIGNNFLLDSPRWFIVCVNLVSTGNKDLVDVYYSRCLTAGWLWGNRWIAATGRFSGFVSSGNSFFIDGPRWVIVCVNLVSTGNKDLIDVYCSRCLTAGLTLIQPLGCGYRSAG